MFRLQRRRGYTSIPGAPDIHKPARRPSQARRIAFIMVFVGALAVYFSLSSSAMVTKPAALGYTPRTPSLDLPKDVWHSLAQYAPYYPVGQYTAPPAGCVVDQVNILERHGARFPTASPGKAIKAAVAKLQAVSAYKDHKLDFIKNYTYVLGTDNLVPFGAAQIFDNGQETYVRYKHLVSTHKLPFVRSSDSERVVASAKNWTAGFSLASKHHYNPTFSVIIDENRNDTLDDGMCPNAPDSDEQVAEWQAVSAPPIIARLEARAPGANLTANDVFSLLSLCAFDTVATAKASPWCGVFNAAEFEAFEYNGDVGKYYGTGYGNALGPVQGVGYINELLARLTDTPVSDHTQTNTTLSADPATFPLRRTIYADFSHDNQMIAIYAALGLFHPSAPLSTTRADPHRAWRLSQLVPFAARMAVERLHCRGNGVEGQAVRIIVNDRVQSTEFCGGHLGMCYLDRFVESQSYSRNDGEGDWEKCGWVVPE